MIEWKEAYSTGNEAIDRQHKLLFDFFNDFEIIIQEGKGAHYLEKSFGMLESYAKAHFRFEEGCMHASKCPVEQKNKMSHQMFLVKVEEYKKVFESGKFEKDFFMDMHHFIEQWITNHIIGIDTHLKECMSK